MNSIHRVHSVQSMHTGIYMKPEAKQYTAIVGGRPVEIETGKLAGQAGGAVTIRLGDLMVFASATMSSNLRENIDFFPSPLIMKSACTPAGAFPAASSAVKAARPPMPSSPLA